VRQLGERGAPFRRQHSWRYADGAGDVAKHRVLPLEKRRRFARVRNLEDHAPIVAVDQKVLIALARQLSRGSTESEFRRHTLGVGSGKAGTTCRGERRDAGFSHFFSPRISFGTRPSRAARQPSAARSTW